MNYIAKFILTITLLSLSFSLAAQDLKVKGRVVDYETMEPLPSVHVRSMSNNATTDLNGEFTITVNSDDTYIKFSFIGYRNDSVSVSSLQDVGTIKLITDTKIMPDIIITSQLAVDRKTPIAISNIRSINIEERLGNGEFVEALKYTPGVHANKQGGGWGDSEIFMRGFDNTNIAILVNGIPVNDMETGTLYWSNLASLSDVTAFMQTQRGIGANKVSAPSVGGSINIVTKGADAKRGGSVSYSAGNNGYQKTIFNVNTGLSKSGWAASLLGSYSSGDGYVQGGDFRVYNYYLSVSKIINDAHRLNFLAFGAPQYHYMRSNALTTSEWEKVRTQYNLGTAWRTFNPDYGFDKNGNRKSNDYNPYHNPIISLSHTWDINDKSNLSTKAYMSVGRGYKLSGQANSDKYSEYDWFGANYGVLNTKFRKEDGTFDYAMIEDINAKSAKGSEMIMSKSLGNKDWYGLITTYSNRSLDCVDWFIGMDFRYYKSLHKNTISNLFGGEYYIDPARNGVDIQNNPQATAAWKQQHLKIGDAVYRDYDSHIMQEGVFGQAEYTNGKINTFISGSLNYSDYWRYDRFYNTGDNARSKTIGFWGGYIKSGVNYRLNHNHNIYLNVGFNSKIPQFRTGVFMSSNTSNTINKMAKNEKTTTIEGGYSYNNNLCSLNLNAYYTRWIDKSMTKQGSIDQPYYINMTGVNSKHMGVELEFITRPIHWVEAGAMLSVGNWRWDSDDVVGYAYNLYGQAINEAGATTEPGASDHIWAKINMKDVHMGGSAQTTAALNVTFKPFKALRIGSGYTYYDRNYAYYTLSGSSLKLGQELYVAEPWEIPSYGNIELWSSYQFKIGKMQATLSGQVSNLMNDYYIEKAWDPSMVSKASQLNNKDDVYYFYSIGRTWSMKFKLNF